MENSESGKWIVMEKETSRYDVDGVDNNECMNITNMEEEPIGIEVM